MIFGHLHCSEAQKISCAIFQLAEEASYWWESRSRDMTPEDLRALTWDEFKEMLINQYFPQSFRDQKKTEVLQLKQGTLSVVDYERRFNKLSRHASILINTEVKKARHFERGLRREISRILTVLELPM